MSQAEIQALKIRDRAVRVVLAHGTITAPNLNTYSDARLRIAYCTGKPNAIDIYKIGDREQRVFGVIWSDLDCVTVLHRAGSWEQYLQRLVKVS
jgi:hypothetical protein